MTKIFIFFIVFALILSSVIAEQPALPTTVYGQVLDELQNPEGGIPVSVVWTDLDGKMHNQSKLTLNLKQAETLGSKNYLGHYFFNDGYVKAKPDSEIRVIINGFEYDKIKANPGGIVRVRDAVLYPVSSGIATTATPTTDSGNYDGPGTDSDATYPASGNSGAVNSEQKSGYSSVAASPSSKIQYEQTTPSFSLPTTIVGQLLDEDGDPIPEEDVYASWIDDKGNQHLESTETISKSEAKKLGNKSLEGYYRFNNGSIRAKPGTNITLSSGAGNKTEVKSSPGNLSIARTLVFYDNGAKIYSSGKPLDNGFNLQTAVSNLADEAKENSGTILILAFFLLILIISIVFITARKKIKKKIKNKLYRKLSSFSTKKVKSCMSSEVISVQKTDNLEVALKAMVEKNVNSIVVFSKEKPIGMLSESDFLGSVYGIVNPQDVLVKGIMSTPLKAISPDVSILDCMAIMVKTKFRKIAVVKGEKLEGIISMSDILGEIDTFFKINVIDSSNVPSASTIMKTEILEVDPEMRLEQLCAKMAKAKSSFALVSSEQNPKIVTSKDLLTMYYRNIHNMGKFKVKQLNPVTAMTISQSADVFDILNLTLSHNFRNVPIVSGKKIVGIVDQLILIETFNTFIRDTLKLIEGMELEAEKERQKE